MAEEGKFWIDEAEGELVIKDDEQESRYVIEEEINLNDQRYLILVKSSDIDKIEADAVVMKLIQDGKEEVLSVIEDDEEFNKVKEAYDSI